MNPSIQKLAQVMQARQECGELPYVLLLGSSLSLTSAVRRAFAGAEDWEVFWGEMQCRAPVERKALLKGSLEELGLEPGYQAVARLAKAGYFNLILTLNVDDAIDDAVRPLPADQSILLIYDGSNAAQIVEALHCPTPRIKVVKLRGDINAQALPLTVTGQFEFPEDLERSVSEWLKRDMILVGDIPYDADVQRCIKQSTGALWCILPDEPASDSFIKRVKQVRPHGEIITGVDAVFNKFFTALAIALKIDAVLLSQVAETSKQELYDQGMARFWRGEWTQTIHIFQQILDIDNDYKDAAQILAQAKKQEHLEQLYAMAKQAEVKQDWPRMIAVCKEIIGIAPFYRHVQRLLWKAGFHSAMQRAGAIWARRKTSIVILAVLLLMVAGVPVLIIGVGQPTLTPPTPQVGIEAFLITKEENQTVTVKPHAMITAKVQEIIQIQVKVYMTYKEQGEDLMFTWHTCRKAGKPVQQKIGNPEMLYVAPTEPGSDCICVVVEKGGVLLDRDEIFVDVQK